MSRARLFTEHAFRLLKVEFDAMGVERTPPIGTTSLAHAFG